MTSTITASAAGSERTTKRPASPRLSLSRRAPDIYRAMLALDDAAASSGVEAPLAELIRIRASQINGCGYCLDVHTTAARNGGEIEQRIYALPGWRESPLFTARERAALALVEAITLIHDGRLPDEVYEQATEEFDEPELAAVIWLAIVVNAWNRVGISSRLAPDS
jgi:AhpD family alkylhydroperoxidase